MRAVVSDVPVLTTKQKSSQAKADRLNRAPPKNALPAKPVSITNNYYLNHEELTMLVTDKLLMFDDLTCPLVVKGKFNILLYILPFFWGYLFTKNSLARNLITRNFFTRNFPTRNFTTRKFFLQRTFFPRNFLTRNFFKIFLYLL
jgi:hypothetical protein